jgi:hypothetical protein
VLFDLVDAGAGDLREDAVGLDVPDNLDLRDFFQLGFEQASHAIGVLGAAAPEIASEQGFELHGDETHFGGQLHPLLAQVEEIGAEAAIEEDDGFAAHDAVFRPAEREHVDAEIARGLAQILAEAGGGVGDAGAIDVEKHFVLVGERGERADFIGLIDGAHLGRLRDGDDAGLDVMLISDAVIGVADGIERDFAIVMREGNQLASSMFFGGAAFVGVDVGVVAAKDGVIRAIERLQAQNIGAGSVEGEKDVDAGAEMFFELGDGGASIRIVSVGDDVALVGASDGREDFGMNSGVVIAGKTAAGLSGSLWHISKQCSRAERSWRVPRGRNYNASPTLREDRVKWKLAVCFVLVAALGATVAAQTAGQRTARYFDSIRQQPSLLLAFLHDMPKGGDLHNHLSGAIYAEDLIDYAAADNLCVDRTTSQLIAPPCDSCEKYTNKPGVRCAYEDHVLYNQIIDAWSMRNFRPGDESGHDHFFATFDKFELAADNHVGDSIASVVNRAAGEHVEYIEFMHTADGTAAAQLGMKLGWSGDVAKTREKLLAGGLKETAAATSKQLAEDEARARADMKCGTPDAEPGCGVTVRYLYQVLRGLPPAAVFA